MVWYGMEVWYGMDRYFGMEYGTMQVWYGMEDFNLWYGTTFPYFHTLVFYTFYRDLCKLHEAYVDRCSRNTIAFVMCERELFNAV